MADRRMLSKKITDHDNFISLSASAQALYMHLCMSADDEARLMLALRILRH